MNNVSITLTRGQIADICYALALAMADAVENNCPISAEMYNDIRKLLHRQTEPSDPEPDIMPQKPRERRYCMDCVHCESNSVESYCLLKSRCVSLTTHAEECSNYTEIQKP